MIWKWFEAKNLIEAMKFAESGGIAIHENARRQGKEFAQMYAADNSSLVKAGEELGLQKRWIQKGVRSHFDLKGDPLRAAKRKCQRASISD